VSAALAALATDVAQQLKDANTDEANSQVTDRTAT
jgi:hypothetical protein